MSLQFCFHRCSETIDNDRAEDIVRSLESCFRYDPQLIMVVVSNNNANRYAAIKKKCCVDRAIPTQVMVQRTITPKGGNVRSLMSVATKVAIQINCKLGSAPWFIKLPLTGLMVVGFDVTHDARDKRMSYGALVATMDQRQSCKYFSAVSSHANGDELSNNIGLSMTGALKEFRSEHGVLPSKIVFYRDGKIRRRIGTFGSFIFCVCFFSGVGEGQVSYVKDHEVADLRATLERHYHDVGQELRFTFLIVNKRINTRFFKGDKNPVPGTIVDDVVTLPERYDFYLVPQEVRQGTVSPTSYNVIEDTMMLPPDKLQLLTYKMCHIYYNW